MINRQEVMEFAHEFGLTPNVIEKDYVLGWLLAGISSHPVLAETWIFKGGTCLKKCYFETYRFSEDLDFTLTDPEHLNEDFLIGAFNRVAEWVYDAAGIEIPPDAIRFEIYANSRGTSSGQGRVGYRGPLRRGGDAPRIKLDLTGDEVLVLEPAIREVHHPYSDRPENGIHVRCYCFEEVFAEKIRALAERERPRDLYDVIHLYRHDELRPDRVVVLDTLERKCAFKGIAVPTIETLENQPARVELEAEWENMLGHQLPALPPFDQFWQELPTVFGWLHGMVAAEKVVMSVMPAATAEIDDAWQPPAMGHAWRTSTPLEVIRFAAANRLCIELGYRDDRRLVEPYALRRTRDGNLLLYAVKHETGEARSYRVDRIQSADVTKISFVPRYLVEITPASPISASPIRSKPTSARSVQRIGRQRVVGARSMHNPSGYGPKYIFECVYCRKKFTRNTMNSSLNPHKDKNGYPCPGRMGVYVETKL